MQTSSTTRRKPTYRQALAVARSLSLAEQRRLRDELAQMIGVELVHPKSTLSAIRRGRRLAKAVQTELAKKMRNESLDDSMRQLRGRSWS